MNNENKLVRIDVRLPEEILKKIEEMAEKEALPRSVFLRSLIVKEIRKRREDNG